jgi:hypothetical protein
LRLIACVSWFDEPAHFLTELTASMGKAGIDHAVFCDGAYALYPQGRASSGSDQHDAIAAAAAEAGMGVTIHVPPAPWPGNEVEKRTALFALGHAVAQPGVDWLWVCDADELITEAPGLREHLQQTKSDVASVMVWEGDRLSNSQWNAQLLRKLFRAHPKGIRVERYHARYLDGDDRVLWNPNAPLQEVPGDELSVVRVQHRPAQRHPDRLKARATYYDLRTKHQVETFG